MPLLALPVCPYCAQDTLREDALGRVRCRSNPCARDNQVGGMPDVGRQVFAPLLRAGCDACATERTAKPVDHAACTPWGHMSELADALGYERHQGALGAWVWMPRSPAK